MGRILVLLITSLALISCVTEQTFVDSKKQVRSLEFDKEDAAKTRLVLGLSYLENGRFEQAKFNLEKALEFGPKRADVNYSLGYYYQMVGEVEVAEDYYLEAISLEPKNPDTLNNYGTFLCNLGQVEKAEKYFQKAINISKYTRAAESYENMAICALGNEQLQKAENYFEMSFKHNPSRANNLLSLAGIKYGSGDLVAALDFYGRYLRLNQLTARGLLLGYILENKRGRLSEANKYSSRLTSEFNNSREALYFTTAQVQNSEFEQLRKKYKTLNQSSEKPAPKIRITRKSSKQRDGSAPTDSNQAAGLVATGALAKSEQTLVSSLEVAKVLRQKVEMFSAPLTDTEAIDIPQQKQKAIALSKESPLPQEKVLLHQVSANELVNDRAETAKGKLYLSFQLPELTVPSHKVLEGESLYGVSVAFNVKLGNLNKWNRLDGKEPSAGQVLYVADPNPIVTVEQDMLLSQLANRHRVKLSALMQWNQQESDGWVKSGSRVIILDPAVYLASGASRNDGELVEAESEFLAINIAHIRLPTHKVQPNEFLYKISRKYNIKIDALMRWNRLKAAADIKAGRVIYLTNPDIYYRVEQEQKLSDVANLLRIDLSQLMAWNNVESDGLVKAGTKLLKVNAERYQ